MTHVSGVVFMWRLFSANTLSPLFRYFIRLYLRFSPPRYWVPKEDAILHHYRKCPAHVWSTCYPKRITDSSIVRFQKELVERLELVRRATGIRPTASWCRPASRWYTISLRHGSFNDVTATTSWGTPDLLDPSNIATISAAPLPRNINNWSLASDCRRHQKLDVSDVTPTRPRSKGLVWSDVRPSTSLKGLV